MSATLICLCFQIVKKVCTVTKKALNFDTVLHMVRKKLEFRLASGTTSSQILLALGKS